MAGRWHLDPGDGIVQSADQDRGLARWMGVDPYAAVEDPRHRISIHAVRVWEDQVGGDPLLGVPRGGAARPAAPAQQPQHRPPGRERPEPGVGMGD
ncbi:hypothetical protein [Streptomyces sp. NPDC058291]|uniref:hypothetical protein n=1 Tax=Streptomyces sp. NPDC058291 TaxID=3346427 RepID=UPI0036E7CAA0